MSPILSLFLASLGLLVGPLCRSVGAWSRAVRELVDGFALVLVAGLCVMFVLPHVVREIGFVGLLLTVAGVGLPSVAHGLRRGSLWSLGLLGLVVVTHVLLDGAVLSIRGNTAPLAWAVVAHRLPVGFAIVVAVEAARQPRWVSWGLVLMMVVATVLGYGCGPTVLAWLPEAGPVALEALVAGVLLHVIFGSHTASPSVQEEHQCSHGCSHHHHEGHSHEHGHGHHHDHEEHEHPKGGQGHRWSAAGGMGGLLVLFVMATRTDPSESDAFDFLQTLGVLVLESSPALLIGYGLAGVVPSLLTPTRVSTLARGGKLIQSLRGVVFGLPLPVCSCGVLPLYESLIRRGAPPAAAMAFFVTTPELGLDAVLLSIPLLGSALTVARVASAFAVALLVAILVGGSPSSAVSAHRETVPDSVTEPWGSRVRAGLRFGFVEVFDHTMPWIALGLLVAAMAEPMLSSGAMGHVPSIVQVPMAVLIGVPVYVCASGATPLAALALHKGLSAGAAIAFLIAGPATNITTFGVLARLHGRRTALLFGISVTGFAILAGWTIDGLGISGVPVLEAYAEHEVHHAWFAWICAGGLGVLTIASLFRQGPRGALSQILQPIHAH